MEDKISGKVIKVKIKGNTRYAYIIASVTVVVIATIILLLSIKNSDTQYMVQNGTIENAELSTAFVVKDETVIEKDMSKVILPVVSESHRVAKGSVIATYKGSEYENYLTTLEKLDKEILELMKDLPTVYSSEIENIESQIYSSIKAANNESSYIQMQEYKTEVNNLISKRAELIGNLSPTGAAIKGKIVERNAYVAAAKKSNDNVIARRSGIVSYETDGLEERFTNKNIDSVSVLDMETACKNITVSNNKIKIVNNYEAYLITKVSKDNFEYMKQNKNYTVRLIGDNTYSFDTTLYSFKEIEGGYEVIFKIINGIEHLISTREMEVEIIWWNSSGLFVTSDALYTNDKTGTKYVKVIKNDNYVDIPVKLIKQSDKYCIIDNYSTAELKEMGLTSKNTLKVYDRLVMPSKESEENK